MDFRARLFSYHRCVIILVCFIFYGWTQLRNYFNRRIFPIYGSCLTNRASHWVLSAVLNTCSLDFYTSESAFLPFSQIQMYSLIAIHVHHSRNQYTEYTCTIHIYCNTIFPVSIYCVSVSSLHRESTDFNAWWMWWNDIPEFIISQNTNNI